MPHLLGSCTPIIFSTQEFMEAYEAGIEAHCSNEEFFLTEQELIRTVLQCLLERWDHCDQTPISLEWSIGFLVGQLHALFVPALAYLDNRGLVQYKSEVQKQACEPANDSLPGLAAVS